MHGSFNLSLKQLRVHDLACIMGGINRFNSALRIQHHKLTGVPIGKMGDDLPVVVTRFGGPVAGVVSAVNFPGKVF